tara:strand:- start:136603 stop:137205 length:603 start_codon:yes stop_codon:yes gene_type:complete
MLKPFFLQKGVSLIELMIGLIVAAILLAMGVPTFSTFIQNSKIRNTADSLQNGLSLARAEAVKRNANVQFVLGANTAWQVGCETATAACPASIQAYSGTESGANAEVATVENTAGTNTEVGTVVFTDTLAFNGLGGVTNATLSPGSDAVFDITNPTGGICAADDEDGTMRCLRVLVTQGGQIRMCDPALTISKPGDPQAC